MLTQTNPTDQLREWVGRNGRHARGSADARRQRVRVNMHVRGACQRARAHAHGPVGETVGDDSRSAEIPTRQ